MKVRPQRKSGLSVSLSKKFYQRSTNQTQQQIQRILTENTVKKQIIQRMTNELQNLQHFLQQTHLSKLNQKPNQPTSNSKNIIAAIKTHTSPNKNTKSSNFINMKANNLEASPTCKNTANNFTRSQSACRQSRKRNSNRASFSSIKRTSCLQLPLKQTKQQYSVQSSHQLKLKTQKKFSTIRAKKDQNYIKYLECRLRQMAKQVKFHNEAQLKMQKKTISQSRRA